ncbi:hypothetical protein MTsPCn9_30130 [Croceitalea sp. MTPC9]|uniref:hypothetical protein n=1 Tax=unclassified Croceitalea TaxID=2632280 RepID=UPI002B3E9080|nr:hypothetical protein MTsPCn6_21520 [Croceitalea sp. MTPC6]GMN18073.1 hypothetical protein MTsPCn9_30130 [Croceitalea sp. MTPC9]
MKKFFSLLAILVIIAVSNCSEIPENNDPILGIWSKSEILSQDGKSGDEVREEWIFNDAYLGRYHSYTNNDLEFYTDFSWSLDGETYTIIYTGTDKPTVEVNLHQAAEPELLALENGSTFAVRE